MILIIDTMSDGKGKQVEKVLCEEGRQSEVEYIDTTGMNISHCLGCNYCWLKTPGQCVIKDDYEAILKRMSKADQVWLLSDTKFGFVTYKTKNIVDRVMPLVTMNLHFIGKQMRHVLRYKKNPNWGVIYSGEGDPEYLNRWCERVAINFDGKSLGAYSMEQLKEAISCMQ
ncbi:MAG: NAD(P)H-dependent oxidoreductase [Eubacteriales bacterium]|nr:NAD(P)H-dependent oxidoreductase [Eubacteriales bacterium]